MKRYKIGRIREALSVRLSKELGFLVLPEDLWLQNPVFGPWDLCRWGASVKDEKGLKVNLASWDTMTACVKAKKLGVTKEGFTFEIVAD